MSAVDKTAPSRRRSGDEIRQAILDAATAVFLESGYEKASINAVIERAGGSKRAVYSYFGGKEKLFAAIMSEVSGQALAALPPGEVQTHDLEATLMAFGRQVVAVMMSPTTLALYRVVVGESARFPELGQAFLESGPGRAGIRLAEVLEEFRMRDGNGVEDPARAAEHFIGMLRGDLHQKVVLGVRPPPDEAEIERFVAEVVKIFLYGCGPNRSVR
jgi:AcrR family transcriptional regulator